MTSIPPAAQSAVDRFGCSPAFIRLHWGEHRCIDGIAYTARCLFTDPERGPECLASMTTPQKNTIALI